MLKILKFKGDDKDFLFSSDAHVNQTCEHWENPLWKMRGYNSVADHRRGFVENWNKISDNTKTCFHVGDEIFQDPSGEEFRKLMHELNYASLYCFQGNHVSGRKPVYEYELKLQFPQVSELGLEVYPLTWNLSENKKVVFFPEYADVQINGTFLAICHFPLISHSHMQKRSIHIAAHSHNNCALTSREKGVGMRIDVGFDAWKRPISLAEIKEHLKNRTVDSRDHHRSDNPKYFNYIKLFLFILPLLLFTSCQNLEFKGSIRGNELSQTNALQTKYIISERFSLMSKISQPFTRDQYPIPNYSEYSICWEF
ncbi:MAG: hypothetical protein WC390_06680 [Sulfurimonas sp.]|jgi:calcineurin-like phosphoesterase family protein